MQDFYPFGSDLKGVALYGLDRWFLALGWSFVALDLYGDMSAVWN